MSDKLSKITQTILAGLSKGPVRIECIRTKKLARELRKELQMCDVRIEVEDSVSVSPKGVQASPGVIWITWKRVP